MLALIAIKASCLQASHTVPYCARDLHSPIMASNNGNKSHALQRARSALFFFFFFFIFSFFQPPAASGRCSRAKKSNGLSPRVLFQFFRARSLTIKVEQAFPSRFSLLSPLSPPLLLAAFSLCAPSCARNPENALIDS